MHAARAAASHPTPPANRRGERVRDAHQRSDETRGERSAPTASGAEPGRAPIDGAEARGEYERDIPEGVDPRVHGKDVGRAHTQHQLIFIIS